MENAERSVAVLAMPKAEEKRIRMQRDRARRFVASQARDADDCALLLDALGLLDEAPSG